MSSSPRFSEGRFHNPWPESEPHSLSDLLKWSRERRKQHRPPDPPRNSFPTAKSEIAYPRAGADRFSATWIGHSTVLLQVAGVNIITDPVFSARVSPVQWAGPRRITDPSMSIEELPPIDIVLLSHNHYDHLDKASVEQIARANPGAHWVAPLRLSRYTRRWRIGDIVELDWWGSAVIGGIRITATPARHFAARGFGDRNKSLWCGFAIEAGSRRAYFAGDTAYHPAFGEIGERCGPFDFVMIPIGAYDPRWFMKIVHVDPEEAVRAYRDITAAHPNVQNPLMLGIHWGTFRLTDEPADEPPRRTTARWQDVGLAADRLWIARFGETRLVP
jgi:N-acyl-phosphatidylethanolamine-hydrolysing phospholipase D